MKNILIEGNRKFLLLLMFLNVLHSLQAQKTRTIDSLKNALINTSNDTVKCNTYNHLLDALTTREDQVKLNKEYLKFTETKLKSLNEQHHLYRFFNIHLANGYNNEGVLASDEGDFEKAIYYHKKCLEIKEKCNDKAGMAHSCNNIGQMYFSAGNIVKAFEFTNKGLKLYTESKNKFGIADSYNNLAGLYNSQQDTARVREMHLKSLTLRIEINDKNGIAMSLNNLADYYDINGDTYKAKEYYIRAYNIFYEVKNLTGMATCCHNLGAIYLRSNKDSAIKYIKESLLLYKQVQDEEGRSYALRNMALVYLEANDLGKGTNYAEESFAISNKLGQPELIGANALLLKQIYEKGNQYAGALKMYEIYIKMRDSINSKEARESALKSQLQYEYDKKEAVLKEQQEKETVLAREKSEHMKLVMGLTLVALLLILIFSIIIFKRLKITQRQKHIIEKQKHLVEEHRKEIIDSINYAKRLQEAILPTLSEIEKHLPEHFILYLPKDIIAGDFYWFEEKDDLIYIAAADCTGHGVPGALVSVVCSNALNRTVLEFGLKMPGEILDKTRELVIATFEKSGDKNVKDGMDISLCCLNKNTKELFWAGANNPLWIIQNGKLNEIKPNKQSIGKTDNPAQFTTHTLQMTTGDKVYIFTDGYADQFGGPKGKKYKYKQLEDLFLSDLTISHVEQKRMLESSFNDWKGNLEQVDDVCVIGIKI